MKRTQSGFNLIELMIVLVISTVLIAGLISAAGANIQNSTNDMLTLKLSNSVRSISQLMSNEIRSVGFDGDAKLGGDTDFGITATTDCILYSFDNLDGGEVGVVDVNEQLGFKYENGNIYYGQSVTSCDSGDWEKLNDGNTTFSTLDSVLNEICFNKNGGTDCNVTAIDYIEPIEGDILIKNFQLAVTIGGSTANDSITIVDSINIRIQNTIQVTQGPL